MLEKLKASQSHTHADRSRPHGRLATRLVATAAVAFVAVGAAAGLGVRINTTPSLPRGLYLATLFDPADLKRGDLVAACPDTFAVQRLGRYWTNGRCPGGEERPDGVRPLAKPVAGLPGDTILVDRQGVSVNGTWLPRSTPLDRDRAGRPVEPQFGTHVLGEGEYWLHSGRVPTSIDSRYAGPVRDIREHVQPLWVER